MRQSPPAIAAVAVVILLASLLTALTSDRSTDVAIDQVAVTPSPTTSDTPSPSESPDPDPAATTDVAATDAPSEDSTDAPSEAATEPTPGTTAEPTPATTPDPAPSTSSTPPEPTPDPTPSETAPRSGFTPVPAATYRYDTDGWSQFNDGERQDLPAVTTLEARAPNGGRQIQVRDMRHDDGSGQVSTFDFSFAEDAVRLHSLENQTTVNFFGQITETSRFTADPPGVVATAGMGPGDVMSFQMQGDGTTADVTITVLREESMTIGGETVEAVVVEQVTRLSGDVEGTSRAVNWHRSGDLLTLREEVTSDFTAQGQRIRSEHTAVLMA